LENWLKKSAMENKQEKKEKSGKVYIPLFIVVALILGGGVYWYIDYSKYIKTDDAKIESDNVSVSPKILGRIGQLFVDEGAVVKQGQLIATLDSVDMVAQKQQIEAAKSVAETSVNQAKAKYQYDQKNIKVLEIALAKSQEDFDRAKAQFDGHVITKEQFDHAKKALETAQAQLEAARSMTHVSETQIKSAEASVENTQAQINVLDTQLKNTKLYAPCDGVVAKRWLLPGDIAQPGQSVVSILNDTKKWVSIFLEETKLENVHVGQSVIFTLDTYPGVTFTGKITMIGSNTAAQYSLIPASNASGNFTKVTQRVQIKISIDGTTEGKPVNDYRILSGMSAIVKIIR
jgi:membrane fusion protein (multidrug efflux system)